MKKETRKVWIIGSLVSLLAIVLGIFVGTYLATHKIPFWPRAETGCLYPEKEGDYLTRHPCGPDTDPFAVCVETETGWKNYACYGIKGVGETGGYTDSSGYVWKWRERKEICTEVTTPCALYKYKEGGWGSGCCNPETGEWLAGSDSCLGKPCDDEGGVCIYNGRCSTASLPDEEVDVRIEGGPWTDKSYPTARVYEFEGQVCAGDLGGISARALYFKFEEEEPTYIQKAEIYTPPGRPSPNGDLLNPPLSLGVYVGSIAEHSCRKGTGVAFRLKLTMLPGWEPPKQTCGVLTATVAAGVTFWDQRRICLGGGCTFKATVSAVDSSGKVIREMFGFYNNKQGPEGIIYSRGKRTFETDEFVPWAPGEGDAYITITDDEGKKLCPHPSEDIENCSQKWRILGTFCNKNGSNPPSAGRCPSTNFTGKAVNPFGSSTDGFKMTECGAVYDYGWYLEPFLPQPTPPLRPTPTPTSQPEPVIEQLDWFKFGRSDPLCWYGRITARGRSEGCALRENIDLSGRGEKGVECEKIEGRGLKIINNSDSPLRLHCDLYQCQNCVSSPEDSEVLQCDSTTEKGSYQTQWDILLDPQQGAICKFDGTGIEYEEIPKEECNCKGVAGWACRVPEDCSSKPDELGDWCNLACGYGFRARKCCKAPAPGTKSVGQLVASASRVGVEDGVINTLDYSYLISGSGCWTPNFDSQTDLNNDNRCDALDVSIFFAAWTLQNELQERSSIPAGPQPTPAPTPVVTPTPSPQEPRRWWDPRYWF